MNNKSRFRVIVEGYLIGLIIVILFISIYYIYKHNTNNKDIKDTNAKQVLSDMI